MGKFLKTLVSVVFRPRNYVFGAGKSRRAFFRPAFTCTPPASISARRVEKIAILGCSPLWEGPTAWEKHIFTNFLVVIQHRRDFFHVIFFTSHFLALDFIFSLPECKFHMIFSKFPAAVVLLGHFSGHWRCGSGGGWKVPEKGVKMLPGCPCGVKNALLYVLWRKGDQNRPFGPIRRLAFGILGVGLRPTARGKHIFTNFLANLAGY
jgi:hypothetical protein